MRKSASAVPAVTAIVSGGLFLVGCHLIAGASGPAAGRLSGPATGAISIVSGSAAGHGVPGDGADQPVVGAANPPARWIELNTTDSAIGKTVAEVHGLRLYRFDRDETTPSTSTCSADCATIWPPVTIEPGGNVYVTGVGRDEVGAIRRADGRVQLTLDDSPMYTYSGDTAPGDLNGQAAGGAWFALAPNGFKITKPAGVGDTPSLSAQRTD